MSKFGYKTRGDSSPQGKSRVYYCCHPKDFSVYFDELSKEMLLRYNCAFCYEEEPEHEYDLETLYTDLGRMHLFVVPITADFLYSDNRARKVELEYAKEQHIPILPLLKDSSLAEDFNEICGNLQYLDKNAKDDTTSSYEIKLDKFLAGALIKDEEAEEVRKAFDAYIFLSYRKKDRKYAQDLMRIIHKIDFCRDVAIWYDEFLSPGENFNGAIGQALKKSQLFLMAVTPNLVNEENYVASIEYPMAEKLGKPIMPVEMVETDKEAFEGRFHEVKELLDAGSEEEIARFIWNRLENAKLWSRAHFPDHDYLIGLAYLNGIDVEIDYEKGIALIQGAAERGYEKAIRKMVDIYNKGIGVEQSAEKELYWYEKLVSLYKDKYEEKVDAMDPLMDGLNELILKYHYMEYYDKALELCHYMKKLTRKTMMACMALRYGLYWYSVAENHFGRIYTAMGDTKEARKHLKKSLKYNQFLMILRDEDSYRNRAVSTLLMAQSYEKDKNGEMSQKYIEESLRYFNKNVEEQKETTRDNYLDLMYTYQDLAECKRENGDVDGACRAYQQAIEAGEKADEGESFYMKERIIDYVEKLAGLLEEKGSFLEAANHYRAALDKKLKADVETDGQSVREAWIDYYQAMARICEAEEKIGEAEQFLLLELQIQEQIIEEDKDNIWAMDRVMLIYTDLGRKCRVENKESARAYFEKSEEMRKICAEKYPEDLIYLEMKAIIYDGLSRVVEEKEDWYQQECLAIYRELMELDKKETRYQKNYNFFLEKVKK